MNDSPQLYDYQRDAVEWLKNRKTGLLALDMGLGKSGIALSAAMKSGVKSILVISPAIAVGNWENEFRKWQAASIPHKVVSYNEAVKLSQSWSKDSKSETGKYELLIVDEAHFLKNKDTQRTKAILGVGGIVHKVSRTWALTGTPAPNHPGELWPLLYTFGGTKLNYVAFVERFCAVKVIRLPNRTITNIAGTNLHRSGELKELLLQHMYRKTLSDVQLQLPQISYETITVPGGSVDWEAERQWAQFAVPSDRSKELFAILEKERDVLKHVMEFTLGDDNRTKALDSLDQGVSNLRRYIGLQKVDPIATLVSDELDAGLYPKIVIFAHHVSVVEKLTKKLAKYNALSLYGKIPPKNREENIEKFQRFSSYKVMVCNIQTAATAINLTASNQVLFVEQDWVPANNAQAAKRCHRIGQDKPVFVRFAAIDGSIDHQITETLRRKTKEIASFLKSDLPPPPKVHPLEKLVEKDFTMDDDIDDKMASSPDDIDSLCQ